MSHCVSNLKVQNSKRNEILFSSILKKVGPDKDFLKTHTTYFRSFFPPSNHRISKKNYHSIQEDKTFQRRDKENLVEEKAMMNMNEY